MQNLTLSGTVTGSWVGDVTKTRWVTIETEDGLPFDIPSREFDAGQRVRIEVKEVTA